MKKSDRTKEMFAEALRGLAEGKPVDKVTVGEICARAGKAPATFYRHFRDKYDLAAWDYARAVGAIMARIGRDGYRWRDTLLDGALFWQERRPYLRNLLQNTGGYDSFSRYMVAENARALSAALDDLGAPSSLETKAYVLAYCAGTVRLAFDWILGRIDCPPEQLAQIMEDCLPLPLRDVLLG